MSVFGLVQTMWGLRGPSGLPPPGFEPCFLVFLAEIMKNVPPQQTRRRSPKISGDTHWKPDRSPRRQSMVRAGRENARASGGAPQTRISRSDAKQLEKPTLFGKQIQPRPRATIPQTPGLSEVGRYLLIEPNDLVHFVVVLEELAQLARVQSPVAVRAAAVLPRAGHLLLRSCG